MPWHGAARTTWSPAWTRPKAPGWSGWLRMARRRRRNSGTSAAPVGGWTQRPMCVPMPAGGCAESPLWHGDECYFRAFGPHLPPALYRWRIGEPALFPVTPPPSLPQRTHPVVLRLPTPEGFDLPAIVHDPT